MRYELSGNESLTLRDGRPFGEIGIFGGNGYHWPLPQTITGMVRTAIGFSKDPDFFNDKANQDAITSYGISHVMPGVKKGIGVDTNENSWSPLFPVPADMIFMDEKPGKTDGKGNGGELSVHTLTFQGVKDGQGTDIANPDWLIPMVNLSEKPSKELPFMLHSDFFQAYLACDLEPGSIFKTSEIGIPAPIKDIRIHNSIDRSTFTTEEGKLFANAHLYLKVSNGKVNQDLTIHFDVTGDNAPDISGNAYLGGERNAVVLKKTDLSYPLPPTIYKDQPFLKLILTTPGDFGGWCPDWLKPDLSASSIPYVTIGDCQKEFKVRLRSACVRGWTGVSGWDLKNNGPKAMKKLVHPGTVYVIELKNPHEAEDIAAFLWGKNLNFKDSDSERMGYGECVVGIVMDKKKTKNQKGEKR